MTSSACVNIKTDTVGIITTVKNRDDCDFFVILAVCAARRGMNKSIINSDDCDFFLMLAVCATFTTSVITSAWMAILTTLTPPPTKNCRNIIVSQFLYGRVWQCDLFFFAKASIGEVDLPTENELFKVTAAAAAAGRE